MPVDERADDCEEDACQQEGQAETAPFEIRDESQDRNAPADQLFTLHLNPQ